MIDIQYVTGDATRPEGEGIKIIAHICNDRGAWGRGFVLALSERWASPEADYRQWFRANRVLPLGTNQLVGVEPGLYVVNMIAQHGYGQDGVPPIRYESLVLCLANVAKLAKPMKASVHMPRIGTGLAGGSWERVERIIQATLIDQDIPVTVYDLSQKGKS